MTKLLVGFEPTIPKMTDIRAELKITIRDLLFSKQKVEMAYQISFYWDIISITNVSRRIKFLTLYIALCML